MEMGSAIAALGSKEKEGNKTRYKCRQGKRSKERK